ncbi:lasso peptide biosynthesis PqqD family chaperone [Gorillibacterium sp. sgz500922]|uniref:lasso peptide biosynthesis PqqD family chaperone n=1 Tax=Gorillibacterium sp. sgz500922 TaxID=3446694 RepID=UPI003F666B38
MTNRTEDLSRVLLRQAPGNIVSDMDGETVMLSVQNGNYYNLGEIGGEIWRSFAEPARTEDVIERLTEEYEVEPEECSRQVGGFIELLLREGLIEAV